MHREFQFGKIKKVWRWMALMAAQHVNVLNAPDCTIKNV